MRPHLLYGSHNQKQMAEQLLFGTSNQTPPMTTTVGVQSSKRSKVKRREWYVHSLLFGVFP